MKNLNSLCMPDDCAPKTQSTRKQLDFSVPGRVYFKDLDKRLIECIASSDLVVGCVAWLTHPAILQALARIEACKIVVQKEDFLRPDSKPSRIKSLYAQIPNRFCQWWLPGCHLNTHGSIEGAIRCVGYHNAERKAAVPRMHHKFLVFFKRDQPKVGYHEGNFIPRAVWTGSFNLTHNATDSFENAVVLSDPEIIRGYINEFIQVLSLSEPLDWTKPWCAPEDIRWGT